MQDRDPSRPAPIVHVLGPPDGPWTGLCDALRRGGLDVLRGGAVAEAVEGAPDLVLFDLGLLATGSEVTLADIARLARGASVMVLDARGDLALVDRSLALGAIGFIDEPQRVERAVRSVRFGLRAIDRRRAQKVAAQRARDELTGLASRDRFLRLASTAIARARSERNNVAVLCFDLDRLRELAAPLEPVQVDRLMIAIAQRLRETCRTDDVLARSAGALDESGLARVSGEGFTLLVERLARVEDAARVGERILDALSVPFEVEGRELYLTTSVGIASFPSEASGAEGLLRCAETAAHCAKRAGPNTLQFYSPAMNARAFERLTLESGLRRAIERGELALVYQPRIDIASGRTVAVEALARWHHPELGLVSPAQFIPIAEETGLILPLGEWVLREACRQNSEWQARGLPPVKVSVNVSPLQFRQSSLYDTVSKALSEAGLAPHWLELELTESSLMHDFEAVTRQLGRFRDAGIAVSIDDFGTGYSSLSYLRKFPIEALKIDRSFLREVTTNQEDASIVTAIVLMGKSLRLRLVAEGVETPGQLAFLRIMQCDEAQGFLFSPPLVAAELAGFLAEPERAVA